MKQHLSHVLLITALVTFACASSLSQEPRISSTRVAQEHPDRLPEPHGEHGSSSGHHPREQVGGSLERIELQTPYPADYDAIVAQVARENETGHLPPLKTSTQNISRLRHRVRRLPDLGYAATTTREELPEGTRFEWQDHRSFQHAWRVRKRNKLPLHRRAMSGLDHTRRPFHPWRVRTGRN